MRDVGLPVEDVGEVFRPVNELARVCRVQRVVVAEESSLAVIGHVDVIPAFGPENVAADLNVA